MVLHRGKFIEQAIKKNGLSKTKVADKIGKSRQTIYKYIEKANLDIEIVDKIGKALGEPKLLDEMLDEIRNSKSTSSYSEHMKEDYGDVWKEMYYQLLKKYNKVVIDMFEDLKHEHEHTRNELKKLHEIIIKES